MKRLLLILAVLFPCLLQGQPRYPNYFATNPAPFSVVSGVSMYVPVVYSTNLVTTNMTVTDYLFIGTAQINYLQMLGNFNQQGTGGTNYFQAVTNYFRGSITASNFTGNGVGLTDIPGEAISGGTVTADAFVGDLSLATGYGLSQALNVDNNANGDNIVGLINLGLGGIFDTGGAIHIFNSTTNETITLDGDTGTITTTNIYALTNTAPFVTSVNNFAIGTRYTNVNQRATIMASFQLAAAAAGTAKVSVYCEQAGKTNKLSISAGPLASLTTTETLMMRAGPNAPYYFTDETSGVGATATIITLTSSWIGE